MKFKNCSTLVSNELGAGNPEGARAAVGTVMALSAAEFVTASGAIYACRGIIGYVFSEDMEFVEYVEDMTPFLCLSIVVDSLETVLSGSVSASLLNENNICYQIEMKK